MRFSRIRWGSFALLVLLFSLQSIRMVYSVTFEAAFCSLIPGLTSRQREMCRTSPDAMVAVGDGIRLATNECRYQFRHHRWNCTGIENPSSFGHVVIVGGVILKETTMNRVNPPNKKTNKRSLPCSNSGGTPKFLGFSSPGSVTEHSRRNRLTLNNRNKERKTF